MFLEPLPSAGVSFWVNWHEFIELALPMATSQTSSQASDAAVT